MADGTQIAGTALKTASPMLGAIPYGGPLLSMGASMAGGFLEQQAAQQQKEQAANLREQAMSKRVAPLLPEFMRKYKGEMAASLGGLPGLEMYKELLNMNMAQHARQIRESSPTGAQAVNAMSLALGANNAAVNKLGIENATYKADMLNKALETIWGVGLQKRGLEQQLLQQQEQMLSQAGNLEAAATANKMGGINKVLGAVSSTAGSLTQNYNTDQSNKLWMEYLKSKMGGTGTPTASNPTMMQAPPNYNIESGGIGMPMPTAPTGTEGMTQVGVTPTAGNYMWDMGMMF